MDITSLEKCGIFQDKDCIKEICPFWSKEKMCILDFSGTMLLNVTNKLTYIAKVWQAMDKQQKLNTAVRLLNTIAERLET
jgi:hypothetical protein